MSVLGRSPKTRTLRASCFTTTFIGLALLWFSPSVSHAQEVSAQISRVGDTTHLEFRGRKDWKYDTANPAKNQLVITVPAFGDTTLTQLQAWTCPLIKEVKVDKTAPDNQYQVIVTFQDQQTESFDYLTDDPSYLIFDFYKPAPKPETKAVAIEATPAGDKGASAKGAGKNAKKSAKNMASAKTSDDYQKIERKPAGDETLFVPPPPGTTGQVASQDLEKPIDIRFERGVFDGGDPNYDRFRAKDYQVREEAIIASKQNIYIRFPILAQKADRFGELMKTPPEYEIKANKELGAENESARLLVALFEKKHWGSFFETLNFFNKTFPESKYAETIKNMEAEAHIHLYERDHDPKDYEKFRSIYTYLVETYPDSVLTERNSLLLAYASLRHNDGAETLRLLQRYMLKNPNSVEKDKVRLAMAEAYGLLIKPDDAIRTYQELISNPLDQNYAVEAAYRIGDVQFARREYDKALQTYQAVQKKYPAFRKVFPNAQYNQAECEFWLGQYKNSLNNYVSFLEMFPSHQHGGFALTRVGELLEILGVDQRQVMGAFIEGYFRYPESQGSEVARIRMLSQALKSMKEREKKRALTEIEEIASKSTLPQIQEFSVLMKSDGLSRRQEFRSSLDLLMGYFQANPTTTNLQVFKSRIVRNIADILKEQTEKNNFIEALNFYGKHTSTWLKNSDRIDAPYYQAVAFERAGVTKEARKGYLKILEKLKSIAGKKEEKERLVYEHLPTLSQVYLRLAAIALEDKRYQESFGHLANVKSDLNEEQEVEKVRIGASVSEQMGELDRAADYLEKLIAKFRAQPKRIVEPSLDLARLYLKQGKTSQAEVHVAAVEKMRETKEVVSDDDWAKALELRGDLQLDTKQKLAAVETYTRLLDAFESKYPLNSIRYKAGKILFDEGDLKGAEKIWSRFNDATGDFYKKLAAEKLSQANWQDDYKKYIDRIPAAQELK